MEKCSYCGKENEYEARYCARCATPLIEDPADPRLSSAESLEMLRREAAQGHSGGSVAFLGGNLLLSIFSGHPLHLFNLITHGIKLLRRSQAVINGEATEFRARELLEAVTRYERENPKSAVVLYAHIINEYPNTRVAMESEQRVQMLTRHGA